MANIFPTDIIYATITQRGNILAAVKLSGMRTFSDIVSSTKELLGSQNGLVTFKLRNSSQGWNQEKNIMICPSVIS